MCYTVAEKKKGRADCCRRRNGQTNMLLISPSILASDFSRLGAEAAAVEAAGADLLHIDVMDGHFVPNITLGIPVVKSLRKAAAIPFDLHLMISEPLRYIEDFANAGADWITVHAESDGDTRQAVDLIHAMGKKAGVSVKPGTPADVLFPYLDALDMVLVMTVEPGFGGQSFMHDMLPKIRCVREACRSRGLSTPIEVDGGITKDTIPLAAAAGADVFVAGSFVFGAADRAAAIRQLRDAGTGN